MGDRGRFVLVGLVFALFCELEYSLFFRWKPGAPVISIFFYTPFLLLAYPLSRKLSSIFRPWLAHLLYAGLTGLAALVVLEWIVVGNTPGGSNAIQSAMLLVHGTWAFAARMTLEKGESAERTRRWSWRLLGAGFLVSLLGLLFPHGNLRKLWFLFFPIAVYLAVALVFANHVRLSRRTSGEDVDQ